VNGLQRFTGLDRGLDLRLWSNQFAVGIAIVAAIVSIVFGSAPLQIVGAAGWAFSTWALTRELDPDNPVSAAVASSGVALLMAFNADARTSSFAAFSVTGVLMLAARVSVNSTGRSLKPGDELIVAIAPIIADLLTGLPLRILGVSSLIALYSRRAAVWFLGLAALAVLWLVLAPFNLGWLPAVLALVVLGGFNLFRATPSSRVDDGSSWEPIRWRWMHVAVWSGAILGALVTPWTLWAGVALAGLAALLLERR
jgi:hypothetical protein